MVDEGGVFTWGQGGEYQLGHGERKDLLKASQVMGLKEFKVTTVSCGATFTLASTSGEIELRSGGNW